MAYIFLIIGSFFLLFDIRLGITPLELFDISKFDYSFGRYTLEGLDILPDIIGAIFLFIGCAMLLKKGRRYKSALILSIPILIISIFISYQFPTYSMYDLFSSANTWVIKPQFITQFVYVALGFIKAALTVITLGILLDSILDEIIDKNSVKLSELTKNKIKTYAIISPFVPLIVLFLSWALGSENQISFSAAVIQIVYLFLAGFAFVNFSTVVLRFIKSRKLDASQI